MYSSFSSSIMYYVFVGWGVGSGVGVMVLAGLCMYVCAGVLHGWWGMGVSRVVRYG